MLAADCSQILKLKGPLASQQEAMQPEGMHAYDCKSTQFAVVPCTH